MFAPVRFSQSKRVANEPEVAGGTEIPAPLLHRTVLAQPAHTVAPADLFGVEAGRNQHEKAYNVYVAVISITRRRSAPSHPPAVPVPEALKAAVHRPPPFG